MSQVNLTNVNQLRALYQADQAGNVEWNSAADKQAFELEVAKYRTDDGEWKADSFNKATIPAPKSVKGVEYNPQTLNDASESVGLNYTAIFSLLHEAGVQLKQAGKQARQADREAQVASMKAEAQHMRRAADAALVSACISGGVQIASGGIGLASAGSSSMKVHKAAKMNKGNAAKRAALKSEMAEIRSSHPRHQRAAAVRRQKLTRQIKASKQRMQDIKSSNRSSAEKKDIQARELKKQTKLRNQRTKLDERTSEVGKSSQKVMERNQRKLAELDSLDNQAGASMQHAQNVTYGGQALSQALGGGGQIAAAAFDHQSKYAQADATTQATVTLEAENAKQQSQEIVDAARELIQKAAQTLQEIQQNEAQVASKIWA